MVNVFPFTAKGRAASPEAEIAGAGIPATASPIAGADGDRVALGEMDTGVAGVMAEEVKLENRGLLIVGIAVVVGMSEGRVVGSTKTVSVT